MVIDDDIVISKALKENIFSLIVCISNKIPILICGKHGCSKSLSMQIVKSNMIG